MTIGIRLIQERLIQAVGLVSQAATASSVVSARITTASGGLLQSQSTVPTRGIVGWAAASTLSSVTTALKNTAFLLVASGMIKVCVHQVIVSDI